jgi:hypothetical protein
MNILERTFHKDPSIVARKIGDDFLLVPVQKKTSDLNCVFTMNDVSARIWELFDGKNNMGAIKNKIMEEYEVDSPTVESDLVEFIAKLQHIGAIRES